MEHLKPMMNYRREQLNERSSEEVRSSRIQITEDATMNELQRDLRKEFHDREYRTIYANESLNSHIATQLKVLREQRDWTQSRLAKEAGMAQPRIAVMEDVNYSSWSINTLRRLAEVFDLRLSVTFETFSSLIPEIENLDRAPLERESFSDDRWFHEENATARYIQGAGPIPVFQPIKGFQTDFQFEPSLSAKVIEMPRKEIQYVPSAAATAATA
jgi:transcriptional regulator with XRE-family HTH domain